jgi:hypothetical protein
MPDGKDATVDAMQMAAFDPALDAGGGQPCGFQLGS